MLTQKQAEAVLKRKIPSANVVGCVREGDKYLFLAPFGDEDEGRFDPFFSVNVNTGEFLDWSPHDYDNSLDILNKLTNQNRR